MSDIPEVLKTIATPQSEDLQAFSGVHMTPFSQDTLGWTDPETGDIYPATFDYLCHIVGKRIVDDVYFSVLVRMDHKVVDRGASPELTAYIENVLGTAVFSLASYSTCACVVGAPCEKHSR